MPGFEVGNIEIELVLKKLGSIIRDALPQGWGFTLQIFNFGEQGSNFYISNAQRPDMIRMMKEFILRDSFERAGRNMTVAIVNDSMAFIQDLDDMSQKLQKEGFEKEVHTMPDGSTWTWEKKK